MIYDFTQLIDGKLVFVGKKASIDGYGEYGLLLQILPGKIFSGKGGFVFLTGRQMVGHQHLFLSVRHRIAALLLLVNMPV